MSQNNYQTIFMHKFLRAIILLITISFTWNGTTTAMAQNSTPIELVEASDLENVEVTLLNKFQKCDEFMLVTENGTMLVQRFTDQSREILCFSEFVTTDNSERPELTEMSIIQNKKIEIIRKPPDQLAAQISSRRARDGLTQFKSEKL